MAFLNFVSFFLCLSDAHIKIFAHTVVEEAFVFSAEDKSMQEASVQFSPGHPFLLPSKRRKCILNY